MRKKRAKVFKILFLVLALGAIVFGAGKWLIAAKGLAQANLSPVSLPDTTDELKKMSEGVKAQIPNAANTMKDDLTKKALPVWNQMSAKSKEIWQSRIQPLAKKGQDYGRKLLQDEMGDRLKKFQATYAEESKKLKESLREKFSQILRNIFSPIK